MLTVNSVGSGHGKVVQHVETNGTENVTPKSNVFASVCEAAPHDAFTRIIGDAALFVCGVAPGPKYVDVWVQIDWPSDLPFTLTILIADEV
jgi:hypothetical protein